MMVAEEKKYNLVHRENWKDMVKEMVDADRELIKKSQTHL